jgi:hypothetical protein
MIGYYPQAMAQKKPAFKAFKLEGISPYTYLDTLLLRTLSERPDTVAVVEIRDGDTGVASYFSIRRTDGKSNGVDMGEVLIDGNLPEGQRRWEFAGGLDRYEMTAISKVLK